MPYKREVLLTLNDADPKDREILRSFYLASGIEILLEHLLHVAAKKAKSIEASWDEIARRLGKADHRELGSVSCDYLSGVIYRETWYDEPAEQGKES